MLNLYIVINVNLSKLDLKFKFLNRLFTIIPYDELFYTLDILIKKDRELICFSNWIRGNNRNNKHTSLDDVFEDIFISKLDMSKSL